MFNREHVLLWYIRSAFTVICDTNVIWYRS